MADELFDVVIVGAGAAGLMAAAQAGRLGLKALVLESQREPGRKLLMCGGGRCNVTHAKVGEHDYKAGCAHTLRHVLRNLTVKEIVAFFKEWQAPLVLQEDGCYFSADDSARTILDALLRAVRAGGSRLFRGVQVKSVAYDRDHFNVVCDQDIYMGRTVLIATGGLSYPATGSTGFGYKVAVDAGHQLIPRRPALTPLLASTETFSILAGIVVPVRLSLWVQNKKTCAVEGPLLFTHQGFSGPAALEISCAWQDARSSGGELRADFLPYVTAEEMERVFQSAGHRSLKAVLGSWLAERLAGILLHEVRVDGLKRPGMGELTRQDRKALEQALHSCVLPVRDAAGYNKAEITAGGVDLKELQGASLESRLQPGLYFAGEVVDVHGRIGGFNLHWAWCSAVSAVRAVAKRCQHKK